MKISSMLLVGVSLLVALGDRSHAVELVFDPSGYGVFGSYSDEWPRGFVEEIGDPFVVTKVDVDVAGTTYYRKMPTSEMSLHVSSANMGIPLGGGWYFGALPNATGPFQLAVTRSGWLEAPYGDLLVYSVAGEKLLPNRTPRIVFGEGSTVTVEYTPATIVDVVGKAVHIGAINYSEGPFVLHELNDGYIHLFDGEGHLLARSGDTHENQIYLPDGLAVGTYYAVVGARDALNGRVEDLFTIRPDTSMYVSGDFSFMLGNRFEAPTELYSGHLDLLSVEAIRFSVVPEPATAAVLLFAMNVCVVIGRWSVARV